MDAKLAELVLKEMEEYADRAHSTLIVVGSVAYKSALLHPERLSSCDDIDCVFIYEDIASLWPCPYLATNFYQKVISDIAVHAADMFSTKIFIRGIRISADFVSVEYLKNMADDPIDGTSKYRIKVTDAIEKDTNIYRNFWGEETTYKKVWKEKDGVRYYKLPIHLFVGDRFYPGVLMNKFLYNPCWLRSEEGHQALVRAIQQQVLSLCKFCSEECGQPLSVANTFYRPTEFSAETKNFLDEVYR